MLMKPRHATKQTNIHQKQLKRLEILMRLQGDPCRIDAADLMHQAAIAEP